MPSSVDIKRLTYTCIRCGQSETVDSPAVPGNFRSGGKGVVTCVDHTHDGDLCDVCLKGVCAALQKRA